MAARGRRKRNKAVQSGSHVVAPPDDQPKAALFRYEAVGAVFSGPLPPPEVLANYEEIVPGAAERLIKMAEAQAEHRRSLERTVVTANSRSQLIGQRYAFILSLLAFALSGALVYKGQSLMGLGLVIANIVALAAVFVYSKRSQARERQEKWRAFPNQK